MIEKVVNIKVQEIFDKNISLHQSVLEEIRDAVRELKEQIRLNKNNNDDKIK